MNIPSFKLALINLHGDVLWGKSLHYYNPLGVTTLAGYLKSKINNIEIRIYDTLIHSYDEIAQQLEKFSPSLTGISGKTDSLFELRTVIEKIRSQKSKIVLGGITPTIIYEDLLKEFPEVYIIRGEGEYPLYKLILYILGKEDINDIPNIAYKDQNDKIIENKYSSFDITGQTFQPSDDFTEKCIETSGDFWIESGRGCRGNCSFCSKNVAHIGNRNYRRFPLERTVNRIKEINKKFSIKSFRFADEDFINDDFDFISEFCREVLKFDFPFKFEIDATIRGIYNSKEIEEKKKRRRQIWKEMEKVGLSHIFIGIESLSDSQLKRYNKGITVKDITEAIRNLNISYSAGFIPFDPFVTVEELRENFINLKNTGIINHINTPIKFLRLQRNTDIAEKAKEKGLITGKTENLMCYTYKFKSEDISKIAEIVLKTSDIFKTYGHRINYLIRPAAEYSLEIEKTFLDYLSEKNQELKNRELDFLIDITENYRSNEKVKKIESNFLNNSKTIYSDILKESVKLQDVEKRKKLEEICKDFIDNL